MDFSGYKNKDSWRSNFLKTTQLRIKVELYFDIENSIYKIDFKSNYLISSL